ncbi:MAG: MerR family transcriptional regulator [Chloroflexota bacterium]
MIRIGQFSRISQVSIKTLRFYDEQGLLHPASVDDFTGYRYYTFEQLPRLYRILALKEMGFPLQQIGQLLDEELSPEQLRGMLKARRAEIQAKVQEEMERLARVEARLSQIEQESSMNTIEVVIKKVEPLKVASIRDTIPAYSQQGALWNELEGYLAMQRVRPTGPCFTMYYDEEYKERDVDAEVCEPIEADLAEFRNVKVRTLPGVEVAAAIHRGAYTTLGKAVEAVIRWTEANGYRITGPEREVYIRPGRNGSQADPETVTEIQFPVEKK